MRIFSALKFRQSNNLFQIFERFSKQKEVTNNSDYSQFLLQKQMRYPVLLVVLFVTLIPKIGVAQSTNIYLHTDRDYYFPGDTVWFKGYFLSEGLFANNLHNMYMKIIDTEGKEIQQSVALINNGVTASYFKIPTTYTASEIYINANTVSQQCPDNSPYFKRLRILQQTNSGTNNETQGNSVKNNGYQLNIVPEGGVLLSGLENKVVIQVFDGQGYPSAAQGKLLDDKGTVLDEFKTDSVGLAVLQLTTEADRAYTIEWTAADGNLHKNLVPKSVYGSKINLVDQDSTVLVQVQTTKETENVVVRVGIGKRKLFDQELQLKSGKKISIPLQKQDLEIGILQASLFDTQQQVLSRRSLLLEQEQLVLSPQVTLVGEFKEKSEGKINVQLPEGEEIAKLSVSITDIAIPVDTTQSILTDIYFQSLSQEQLTVPQTYWERAQNKDLFIQTQKWDYVYCPSADTSIIDPILTIKGQINLEKKSWSKFYEDYQNQIDKGKKGNVPARGASFGYQDEHSDRMQYLEIMFDQNGQFNVPNLIVFDSLDTKFVQIYRSLKFTPFKVKYQFADQKQFLKPIYYLENKAGVRPVDHKSSLPTDYYTLDATGKRVLQTAEVTRTKKQREIDRLQKRFQATEPHTAHDADIILLPLMDSVVIKQSQSLRDYVDRNLPKTTKIVYILNGKLTFDPAAKNKRLENKRVQNLGVNPEMTGMTEIKDPNTSFLDEDVSNYPYLKFYHTYNSVEYTGENVLVVFEYSPAEIDREIGKSEYLEKIMGYMPIKEFNNKVYSSAKERLSSNSDNRLTLYWDPYFDFEKGTKSKDFVFFNSSKNKGVWVTVQGMTSSGKVIYFRKAYR